MGMRVVAQAKKVGWTKEGGVPPKNDEDSKSGGH